MYTVVTKFFEEKTDTYKPRVDIPIKIANFILVILTLLLLPNSTFAKIIESKTGQPEWFVCQSDDQCIIVQVPCSGCVSMNKNYVDHASELGTPVCLSSPTCNVQQTYAVCQNQKCILASKEKTQ